MTSSWSPAIIWCVDCDAPMKDELFLDCVVGARCSACRGILAREVEASPTTAYLTRFEPSGLLTSKTGDSASGLCPYWIDLASGSVLRVEEMWGASTLMPLIPCLLKAHEGDHAWDARSARATMEEEPE